MDKTIDDETVGQLGLNNPDTANHGDQVVSAQLQINANSKAVTNILSLAAAAQVTLDLIIEKQYVRVQGSGGAVTINAVPFGNSVFPPAYSEIIIVGQDDTNTVTLTDNDADYGCRLNGNATLQKGYMIVLIYDDNHKRYFEQSRNF